MNNTPSLPSNPYSLAGLVAYATPESNDWYVPSTHSAAGAGASPLDEAQDSSNTSSEDVARQHEYWQQHYAHGQMPPPPPKAYMSRDELLEDTKGFAKQNGYRLVVKHSRIDPKGAQSCVWLQCEFGGVYRNRHNLKPEDRKRKRASRKTDCPFEVVGKQKKYGTEWTLYIRHAEHNHGLIKDMNQQHPEHYPDLEAALFNWHQDLVDKGETPHGIAIKSKANELFATMPQYQGMTPRLDREWLYAYRERWGFKEPIVSKKHPSGDMYSWVPPHAETEPPLFQDVQTAFQSPTLFEAVRRYVEQYMSRFDCSHDYQHILRVFGLAKVILTQELLRYPGVRYDVEAIYLAAMLHDVGDRKYVQPGEDPDHQIAELLLTHGATAELALKVQTIVKNVSYSNESKAPRLVQAVLQQHPELGIVQDADRLDAIGAVGIARCFAFGGAKAPGRGLQGCVDHFEEKLGKLEGMMKTETGRAIARERTLRLQTFQQWWADEQGVLA